MVTFGEKLFGPTRHLIERATTRVDSRAIRLETEKGLAVLHPGDWASRATWILALNACFHKNAVRGGLGELRSCGASLFGLKGEGGIYFCCGQRDSPRHLLWGESPCSASACCLCARRRRTAAWSEV